MRRKFLNRFPFPLTIWGYLSVEFLFSFLVAFSFFFFIFFVNQLLLLAEDALSNNIPFWAMVRLIIYALPTVISLSAPFGSLVGCLMAVGRLSSESEIISLRASGFPLTVIFVPFMVIGIIISLASFFVNDQLLPRGTYRFVNLYLELFFEHPELELQPYSINSYQNDVILTGNVEGGIIEDIFIIGPDPNGNLRVISAREARILNPDPRRGTITLELDDALFHTSVRDNPWEYQYAQARTIEYNFLVQDITSLSIRNAGPREMSSQAVLKEIVEMEKVFNQSQASFEQHLVYERALLGLMLMHVDESDESRGPMVQQIQKIKNIVKNPPIDQTLRVYKLEYFKKFSLPLASICFIIFAFPTGLFSVRSGRSVGFGIGLLVSSAYWGLLVTGQSFGTLTTLIDPFLSVWIPNFVVLLLGGIIFVMRLRK